MPEQHKEDERLHGPKKMISLHVESRHFLRALHDSHTPSTQPFPTPVKSARVAEWLLFFACFFAFAYFNQGGGWNQNSRFAEVRAIVEEGRFAIDNFLVYKRDPATGGNDLVRLPLDHAEYDWQGKRRLLAWVDMTYSLYPVTNTPSTPDVELVPMIEECSSGDIGYVKSTGHFHPNKPPGTSFFAVPAYWIIFHVERLMGINPDHWWPLTVNAWLASVFSVGLVSAFGCVLVFRFGREMSGGRWAPALLAALALAFGTTYFPFGTLLFDHNLTATLLFGAFFCLWRLRQKSHPLIFGMLAGLCAGMAALTNYIAAGAGVFLGLYALLATQPVTTDVRSWNWRAALHFTAGVLPIFLLLCGYNVVNFHSPFKLANDFQNPLFADTDAFLGMFHMPRAYVAGLISVSPYRGIFFLAPVLIMSLYGLTVWLLERKYAPEARLCLAIFGFFFFVNVCFNGYHGGFAAGPRYLVPGLPFLALPLIVAFLNFRILTVILAVISIAQQLLLTATDAQNSLAVGGHARIDDAHRKDDFWCQIVGEYAWPLFAYGRAWPVLNTLIKVQLENKAAELKADNVPKSERQAQLDALEQRLREHVAKGEPGVDEPKPMILAAIKGPVSVNPIGAYDGLLTFTFFPANSKETDWNSFNIGEFLLPQSRWSILPLLLVTGGLCGWLLRAAMRRDEREELSAV